MDFLPRRKVRQVCYVSANEFKQKWSESLDCQVSGTEPFPDHISICTGNEVIKQIPRTPKAAWVMIDHLFEGSVQKAREMAKDLDLCSKYMPILQNSFLQAFEVDGKFDTTPIDRAFQYKYGQFWRLKWTKQGNIINSCAIHRK